MVYCLPSILSSFPYICAFHVCVLSMYVCVLSMHACFPYMYVCFPCMCACQVMVYWLDPNNAAQEQLLVTLAPGASRTYTSFQVKFIYIYHLHFY